MKKCPKCEATLNPEMAGTIEADQCPKCMGVWFDKDELREVKDFADADLNWLDFEIWKHEELFKTGPTSLKCATCDKAMVSLVYGETGVEVDYCPSCRATWLDEGEFRKIVDALENELLTKSLGQYVIDSVKEAKEILSGPESFVSEWKDLATIIRFMRCRLCVEHPKLHGMAETIQQQLP